MSLAAAADGMGGSTETETPSMTDLFETRSGILAMFSNSTKLLHEHKRSCLRYNW